MLEYDFSFIWKVNMLTRLSLYTLLLCLVPFFAWIFNWQWQGDAALTQFDYFLYWLTETGSAPYALITCGLFALLFLLWELLYRVALAICQPLSRFTKSLRQLAG